MARKPHPNKEIEEALQYAEAHGWRVLKAGKSGHAFAKMLCPSNDPNCCGGMHCMTSIWSTPKDPGNHARKLKRIVDGCIHNDDDDNG